jgi:type I restriction enzyme M protein
MSEDQKRVLERELWNIANTLRGKMDADEYRDYILGFIFYKYLSEKLHIHANSLLETEKTKEYLNITDKDTIEAIQDDCLETLGYFLLPNELFESIAKKGNGVGGTESNYILDELQTILNHIEQSTTGTESEDDFNALFQDIDLNSHKLGKTPNARNEVIAKILLHLNKIDFKLRDAEADVLGDAYEYLISQFAAGAGKKAGEFYTPQQVSKILAKIVTTGKTKLKSAYDPTCGSGSLLLRVSKEAEVSEFFGQELNNTTYNLARMNMILHDVHYSRFDIRQEDTLEAPQHLDKKFEAVVANPPFSSQWKGKDNPLHSNDERFAQYGRLAPTSKADFAFVQHMVYQLAENGTMACVLPHGVLFRGSAEGEIRKYLIKELNYLDAVIGLPANVFYGTSIPTCILVLKKCRQADDSILFIDASGDEHYIKEKTQNVLRESDIEEIVNTYRNREVKDKYSYLATLEEIAENDYNLNIPRYVDTFEEEEPIELDEVSKELEEINKEMEEVDKEIEGFCKELNISTPF